MKHNQKAIKEKIRMLEARQEKERADFYDQIKITFDSLKPLNLLKSGIRDFTHQIELRNNIFEALIPLFTNFISGRVVKRKSKTSFSRVLATIFQLGATTIAARHSHAIFEALSNLINRSREIINKVIDEFGKVPKEDLQGDETGATKPKEQDTTGSTESENSGI